MKNLFRGIFTLLMIIFLLGAYMMVIGCGDDDDDDGTTKCLDAYEDCKAGCDDEFPEDYDNRQACKEDCNAVYEDCKLN